jgi:hypothetical protein
MCGRTCTGFGGADGKYGDISGSPLPLTVHPPITCCCRIPRIGHLGRLRTPLQHAVRAAGRASGDRPILRPSRA